MDHRSVVKEWLNFLRVEKGLSANTLTSYSQDSSLFLTYLEKEKLSLPVIRHTHLTDFLWEEKKKGKT